MPDNTATIAGLWLGLGDQTMQYSDATDFAARRDDWKMPDMPELWGWGDFHRMSGSYTEAFERNFAALPSAIHETGLDASAILVAGVEAQHRDALTKWLANSFTAGEAQGTGPLVEFLDGESGCSSVLRAVEHGQAMLDQHARVLVLQLAMASEERERFGKFALFSDASLALLLSRDTSEGELQLRGCNILEDPDTDADADEDKLVSRSLDSECVQQLLDIAGVFEEDIDQLLYMNLYKPMLLEKARSMGFDGDNTFIDNVARHGHCFGIDPFLNMQSYFDEADAGSTVLLCASSRRYAAALLVQRD